MKLFQNEQLKKEQEEHVKTLLKQAKDSEKEVEQITVVKQEEVEKALADKIVTMRELIVEQNGIDIFSLFLYNNFKILL